VLSEHVRSITFPRDEVEYKFEGGSNPTGIVIKRVDKQRNITMYFDWRKAKFWNYKNQELVNVLYGDSELYSDIYIGRNPRYDIVNLPVLFNSYTAKNVHINEVEGAVYFDSIRNVRIDKYLSEYDTRSFVSISNVQVNVLRLLTYSNVLNEVLINDIVSCTVDIDNNTNSAITVSNQINPTITIP
jgi:hypothetical protein